MKSESIFSLCGLLCLYFVQLALIVRTLDNRFRLITKRSIEYKRNYVTVFDLIFFNVFLYFIICGQKFNSRLKHFWRCFELTYNLDTLFWKFYTNDQDRSNFNVQTGFKVRLDNKTQVTYVFMSFERYWVFLFERIFSFAIHFPRYKLIMLQLALFALFIPDLCRSFNSEPFLRLIFSAIQLNSRPSSQRSY